MQRQRDDDRFYIVIVDQVLKLDSTFQSAVLMKAGILSRTQRRNDAEKLLKEALKIHPEDPVLETAMARLVEMPKGQLKEAEGRLRGALKRNPFMVQAYRLLGDLLENSGRRDEARSQRIEAPCVSCSYAVSPD